MKKEMLINVLQPEECRIAIVEDGVLEELYVERTSHESYVGNIYKGRIVNIEPSIQAAFVDFGVGRNGFLHVSDVEPAYYRHLEQGRVENGSRRGRDRHRTAPRPLDAQSEIPPAEEAATSPGQAEPAAAQAGPPEPLTPAAKSTSNDAAGPGPEPRWTRGRSRRGQRSPGADAASAASAEDVPPAQQSPPAEAAHESPPEEFPTGPAEPATGPKKQHFMDSAERRTEEGEPLAEPLEPASSFSDEDLFFPRPDRIEPESALAAQQPAAEDRNEGDQATATAVTEAGTPATAAQVPAGTAREDMSGELTAAEKALVPAQQPDPGVDFDDQDVPVLPPRRSFREDRRGGRQGGGRWGAGRSGFGRPKPLIQDIFRRGQEVLVQVIKEGIGTKGPTLSTYISIPGRYLVLMPGLNRIGVSRKIADDEQRRRLREILSELQPPKGLGFIIRTAGLDKNKKELQRDLAYLSRLWQVVVRRIRKLKAPAEIYQESDMITRTIRDTFTNEIDTIWVDEPSAFEHAQEFLQIVMPRYASRIKLYNDSEPMFHKYGIESEIARIQQRHVPLPNGGSIVIDQTEALVAIDVNSGNFRADNSAEETAYQMNLLAAKEIARQLRLRDLGGVIVNDFIDMREEKHRRAVERALREAVKRDRARTKILKISAFGIVEMTRQRIRPSLKRSVYQDCPHCVGTGQVKTCESMSIDVMRMLQLAAYRDHIHRVQIRVAEDVANYLLNKKRKEISRLEEQGQIQVYVTAAPGVSPETLEFVCYDHNNNEVKFSADEEIKAKRR